MNVSLSNMCLYMSMCLCAVVGFSIPSFFGFLATRNPVKGMFRLATLGQADTLVQLLSGGRWETLPAFFDQVLSTTANSGASASAGADAGAGFLLSSSSGSVLEWGMAWHSRVMLFMERAASTPNLITIPDMLFVWAGYLIFVLDSCFLSLLASLLASRLTRGDFRRLGRKLSLLLDFIKVTLLPILLFCLLCIQPQFTFVVDT